MAYNFRTLFRWLGPSWLFGSGDGEKVGYTIALMLDESMQRARDGMTARYPSYAGETALALHSRGRAIPRGRVETATHFAQRLIAWRYPRGHRARGSAFALLEQVSEYFGGAGCWTIDARGNRHTHTAAGAEAFSYDYAWAWDTLPSTDWSRFWLVVDGSAFEADATFQDVQAIRRLMVGVAWRPAGTQPEWVVVQDTYGDVTLDVPIMGLTWARWSVNVDEFQLPLRSQAYRYWSLDPVHNNLYAGDSSNFPSYTRMADGSFYDGDPTNFPATVALPNGESCVGAPGSFPLTMPLLDDGDLI